jgi:hypothetical protein
MHHTPETPSQALNPAALASAQAFSRGFGPFPAQLDAMDRAGELPAAERVSVALSSDALVLAKSRIKTLEDALQAFLALDRSFTSTCDKGLTEIAAEDGKAGLMARTVLQARAALEAV